MPIEIAQAQFIFIQPHNPYMAISNDKQKFIGLSEWDMLNTIYFTYTKYYQLNNVVYLKTFPLREIQLFDSQRLIKLPEIAWYGMCFMTILILKNAVQE